jgi:hypothetical protein
MNKDNQRYKDSEKRKQWKKEYMVKWRKEHPENRIEKNKRLTELKKRNKLKALKFLGGKCVNCKIVVTDDNLCIFDFHHPTGSKKEHGISRLLSCKWETILKELISEDGKINCFPLCANCHRLIHNIYDEGSVIMGPVSLQKKLQKLRNKG